ncbi:EpsG family protein [Paenibacillus sp. GP183]|uniref:EpsG family protein n=1 Tax=Paenibacillus sp. GP183 TaxID=1882751 RepID=UPI00089D36B2|nr:EpsG family protein [Paenibacillus sp. GP183]SEC06947.1 transmembrane protein EpsG [Paenibacillus sp. GP183]
MAIFWVTLSLVYLLSFFSRYFARPVTIGPVYIQPNKFLVFMVIAIMVLVSGLRKGIGDTFFYMHSYAITHFSWEDIGFKADFGFNILQLLLQQVSNDPQILIFIVALITNVLILIVLYKYARLFELGIYVYITSGLFLVSMNGIRQFLAAAIAFAATKYIFSGSWIKYIVVILIASTIHQSALILIPVYFIVRRKAWTNQTYILLSVAVILVIGFTQFSEALFTVIKDTKYSEYQNMELQGANFLRVVVLAVPIVFAFFGREKLRKIFPGSDYVVNMSLINLVFMLISTQQWIFARFSIYFGLYNLILIPWVVKLFVPKEQKLIYYAILVSYFIYYFYESVISLNIIYKSDFLIF